ncbi:hypothetical protein CVT24_001258 [Panaeolus cyanescens]|uniref:non-specific serine/threonine protein kinase n=1 Tax=Panaeolus cyanescens TaxID=181874 RepID=A0A409YFX7_9AGAR|nr:hypothetical protein CVT24_001258 [Panaeolus cyanescens]
MTSTSASNPSRALIVTSNNHSHSTDTIDSPLRLDTTSATGRDTQWQPILHASNQVVLYNPHSHALSITSSSTFSPAAVVPHRRRQQHHLDSCPYCKQPLPPDFLQGPLDEHDTDYSGSWDDDLYGHSSAFTDSEDTDAEHGRFTDPAYESRASNYFQLLAIANETSSVTSSPPHRDSSLEAGPSSPTDGTTNNNASAGYSGDRPMAEGYFKSFFQEEYKLGMGANGTVYLCQHVLDGNPLGHFAVKKIAVGQSHSYLLKILREVRLLERLHHPNIITYHHAWLETSQFSSFGPKVPTLHVLMQWAEGGSLDDFIDVRLGRKPAHIHMHPAFPTAPFSGVNSPQPSPQSESQVLPNATPTPDTPTGQKGKRPWFQDSPQRPAAVHAPSSNEDHSRSARIKAFRAYQRAPPEEKERMRRELDMFGGGISSPAKGKNEWTPVHLLSADEIKSLFTDVVEGLQFLHSKSILHLDLKPGNVLLTWDEGSLIPRAMLSDFGTSRDMLRSSTTRSGNTGTLEYTAPESLPSPTGVLRQIDSKADMWSLGMILHKLLFFKLPYRYAAVGDANGEPVSRTEEGEKMDRLEKEVQDYPGFKSTPALVTGFETRRLPRSFLVLLENLLHKAPAGRPSCDRVVTAIREGKFDPLAITSTNSLPMTRASSDPNGNPTSPNLNEEGTEAFIAPENLRLLALPSPSEVLGPEEDNWMRWFTEEKARLEEKGSSIFVITRGAELRACCQGSDNSAGLP